MPATPEKIATIFSPRERRAITVLVALLLVGLGLNQIISHSKAKASKEPAVVLLCGAVEVPSQSLRERVDAAFDLNSASAGQLQELPGIGPALSARIVAEREAYGPYSSVSDLVHVRGIGIKTVERISHRLFVKGEAQGQNVAAAIDTGDIDINSASLPALQRLTGIGPVLAGRIVAYRTEHGPFVQLEELAKIRGISDRMVVELAHQARVGRR